MSRANGAAAVARKPAGSEQGPEELQQYSELMREMDSPDGRWNPEPDAHIRAILRDDVELSSNEIKAINYVKSCCICLKEGGRTAWGKTESGRPLILSRISDKFGWDESNARKHVRRPLAYGFIRINDAGVFGLGARVQGRIEPEIEPPTVAEEGEQTENETGMYIPVGCAPPAYLALEMRRLRPPERKKFLEGWIVRKEAAKKRWNDETARLREVEQQELIKHCESFGLSLKVGKKRRNGGEPPGHDNPNTTDALNGLAEASENRYVHTGYEHTENPTSYNGISTDVHTRHIRKESSKLKGELASSPSEAADELTLVIVETIKRSRLKWLGEDRKALDGPTVANIRRALQPLIDQPRAVIAVLDVLEDKCRYLAKHPETAEERTWGWVVGVVKGEVQNRLGGVQDVQEQIRTAAAGKRMR